MAVRDAVRKMFVSSAQSQASSVDAVGTGFYLLVFPGDVTAPFQKQVGLFTVWFFFLKDIFSGSF